MFKFNIRETFFPQGSFTFKKGWLSILDFFKKGNIELNVPFVDDCCDANTTILPTSYNQPEEKLNFYNPDSNSWEEIVISGGGGLQNLQSVTNEGNTTNLDIVITDPTKGFVLMSPDNNYWRITVDNFGALTTTLIP